MNAPRRWPYSGMYWACPGDPWGKVLNGTAPLPIELPVSRWPAAWQQLHRPEWLRTVWHRLQRLLHDPVTSSPAGSARSHVVLGILQIGDPSDGQLRLARWRRGRFGMAWMPMPESDVDFNDLPAGHCWQEDVRMACGWEIQQAELAAGRTPNEGHIHGYVKRCLDALFAALRQDPAWRTLGSRIMASLDLDATALRRARAMLRWDRSTRPCSLRHYNLAVRHAARFDHVASEAGTFPCAELLLGAWLQLHDGELWGEPLTRLRRELVDVGRQTIQPSTWRLLLRMMPRQLMAMESFYRGPVWPQVADYLLCLECLEVPEPPAPVLVRRTFSTIANHGDRHLGHLDVIEDRATNMGHALRSAMRAEDQACAAADLPQVLDWLSHAQPDLSKTQRRAGWKWLIQHSRAWHDAQRVRWDESDEQFEAPFAPLVWGDYRLEPLHSAASLWEEGSAMRHCVYSRKEAMLRGTSVVVSIQKRSSAHAPWRRQATAEYVHQAGQGWQLSEVQGFANQQPAPAVQRVAARLATHFNDKASPRVEREFYCPRSAPFHVRLRRGCPIEPKVEARLHGLGYSLGADRRIAAQVFAGKFWWVERTSQPLSAEQGRACDTEVITTEEVFEWLDKGHRTLAKDGPFDTHAAGALALHVASVVPG